MKGHLHMDVIVYGIHGARNRKVIALFLFTLVVLSALVAKVASKTSGKAANCKDICSKNGLPKSALYHNYCICLE
ncbi:hypothetical protein EB796_004441 [Bugula neritina]|uniref:Uncharacterized protein n=1 Tax=Bugula neritina TaxID=10212 RepID=A0A7J7KH84_BUGNE|nr:hypothetical protein EB796_004441 [Bugula neritina]